MAASFKFKTATEYANEIILHRSEPGFLADLQVEMSSYYSYLNDKKAGLKMKRAQFWVDWKEKGEKTKSDEYLKQLWYLTPEGSDEIRITTALDSTEKMLSAIKSSIVTASIEAKSIV